MEIYPKFNFIIVGKTGYTFITIKEKQLQMCCQVYALCQIQDWQLLINICNDIFAFTFVAALTSCDIT